MTSIAPWEGENPPSRFSPLKAPLPRLAGGWGWKITWFCHSFLPNFLKSHQSPWMNTTWCKLLDVPQSIRFLLLEEKEKPQRRVFCVLIENIILPSMHCCGTGDNTPLLTTWVTATQWVIGASLFLHWRNGQLTARGVDCRKIPWSSVAVLWMGKHPPAELPSHLWLSEKIVKYLVWQKSGFQLSQIILTLEMVCCSEHGEAQSALNVITPKWPGDDDGNWWISLKPAGDKLIMKRARLISEVRCALRRWIGSNQNPYERQWSYIHVW